MSYGNYKYAPTKYLDPQFLMRLSPEQTVNALAGRRLYRVLCCGQPMAQQTCRSFLKQPNRPFSISLIELKCEICGQGIVIQLVTKNGDIGLSKKALLDAILKEVGTTNPELDEWY